MREGAHPPNANRWGTVQMPFPVPVDRPFNHDAHAPCFLCLPCMRGKRAVRRAFKHRANHWYNESDSTEDDERTASAFRIGHRAGTAVLPPCSTPQQLTEHQNKNTRRGTAGAFILVDHSPPQSNAFLLLHSSKNSSMSPFSRLVIGISAGVFWPRGLNQIRK